MYKSKSQLLKVANFLSSNGYHAEARSILPLVQSPISKADQQILFRKIAQDAAMLEDREADRELDGDFDEELDEELDGDLDEDSPTFSDRLDKSVKETSAIAKQIFDLFNGAKKAIEDFILAQIGKIPFATDIAALFYYVMDSSQSLVIRSMVALVMLAMVGIEAPADLVSAVAAETGVGIPVAIFIQAVEKGTLAASLPFLFAVSKFAVDDSHRDQAKKLLKQAGIIPVKNELVKLARRAAIEGDFRTSYLLIKKSGINNLG